MLIAALIPAYNPTSKLVDLVHAVSASFHSVVVVNDGSAESCDPVFSRVANIPKVTLLRHATNQGKGAALKTGLNRIYSSSGEVCGVVVIDADGQHLVEDALKVAQALKENPESLVIGVRSFDGNVPLRSRVGNDLTRFFFRVLNGTDLSDTQSGLRGIPRSLVPTLLKIPSNGYEFELDMLMACSHTGRTFVQQPIQTVYLDGNSSSHFNPLLDSMKIYFVLFRFTLTSVLSAVIDNAVFLAVFRISSSIQVSQLAGRLVAGTFNYSAVRKVVFYPEAKVRRTLAQYVLLTCISGVASFGLIRLLTALLPLSVVAAKIMAESIIFFANFIIQRDFIFTREKNEQRPAGDRPVKKESGAGADA